MPKHTDVVVAGAGPVGLSTAIFCAMQGLSVVVLEKRTGPHDKACGEGLLPAGAAALREMRVDIPAWGRANFSGISYIDGDTIAEGTFRYGSGMGVRRTALIQGLEARARELGIDLRYGARVEKWVTLPDALTLATEAGSFTCRFLVAADGLHSSLRSRTGLHVEGRRSRRFGVRRHYRIEPWSNRVEVHWADGAEAYVTPVGPDLVGVAVLWDGGGRPFDQLYRLFPSLEPKLSGAEFASSLRGAGPFEQRAATRQRGRIALVGDAAGFLDPLTGEGISLGFRSARALASTLAQGAPLRTYERAYTRLSRNHLWMTRLLLLMRRHPRLRRRVIATLAREPQIFDRMLEIHGGQRLRLADLSLVRRAVPFAD